MNLTELETNLPNGFHDAILEGITVDYGRQQATFSMSLWIGLVPPLDPRQGQEPVMRKGLLVFGDMAFCAIDPPQKLVSLEGGINVMGEGIPETAHIPQPPEGSFLYAFYACDWDSRIYIAARDVRLDWSESEENAWSRARQTS